MLANLLMLTNLASEFTGPSSLLSSHPSLSPFSNFCWLPMDLAFPRLLLVSQEILCASPLCEFRAKTDKGILWLALIQNKCHLSCHILMKTKHSVCIMVFGEVTSHGYTLCLNSWLHTKHWGLHQVPGRGSAGLDQEGGCWKTLHLTTGLCTMPHKQSYPVCEKLSVTSHHLKLQIAFPLTIRLSKVLDCFEGRDILQYLLLTSPSGQVWHKAFFRWVRVQGQSPHASSIPKKAYDPIGIPLIRGTSGARRYPPPLKGIKAWREGPLRPKEISRYQDTLG